MKYENNQTIRLNHYRQKIRFLFLFIKKQYFKSAFLT